MKDDQRAAGWWKAVSTYFELALEFFFRKTEVGKSGSSRYRINKCMKSRLHELEWYHGN